MSPRSTAKSVLLQGGSWFLVVVGLAAMILPGPGLLLVFGGIAMLATQYKWADRRVARVRNAAKRAAANSVQSGARIALSVVGVCLLVGLGVYWGLGSTAPSWWPVVVDQWWLVGGWGTGATLIGSGAVALAMLVHSYVNFRGLQPITSPATSPGVDLRR